MAYVYLNYHLLALCKRKEMKYIIDMISEANENDYRRMDEVQFELQKYFSEIDRSRESFRGSGMR